MRTEELKNAAIYDREERTLILYDEGGNEHFFENKKLSLKKNGYPKKSNWVDIEINDPLFNFGENPRYELTYQRAVDGKFIFEAKKIRDGYVLTVDSAIKEVGQIGIA